MALTPAEKQRAYRARHADRLAAQRPTQARDVLQNLVAQWTSIAGASGLVCQALGAVNFAYAAGLIDEDEHADLMALIESVELPGLSL